METENFDYEFYDSNFLSVLEKLLQPSFNTNEIKETFLPNTFSKINQFSDSNYVEEERIKFVEYLFNSLENTKVKLSDLKCENIDERFEIIIQIEFKIKIIFSDLKFQQKKQLTTSEKIIILEYIGVIKLLNDSNFNQIDQSEILSLLLEKSKENIKKDISGIAGKIFEKKSVKNRISLNAVKETALKLKNNILINKVNADLEILNKTK